MNTEPLEITEQKEVFDFACVKDIVNQALKTKNITQSSANTYEGIPTGYKKIDKITSGFQKGELTTIAVKPGIGKTSFLLSLASNIAVRNDNSLAIFSAERSAKKLVKRMIETETGTSVDKINSGNIPEGNQEHIEGIIQNIAKAKMYIDDTPSLSVDEFCSRAKQLKEMNNIDIIFVDHLELMITSILDKNERNTQLKEITKAVKMMAEELNIPIVLFSQIQNHPTSIETALPDYIDNLNDTTMLLKRTPYSTKINGLRNKGEAEVVLMKHANINTPKTLGLRFIESIGKFVDTE